jgi:hypothetical protein
MFNNLTEPKTLPELVSLLHMHRNILFSIVKNFVQNGFITLFKTIKPAKKFYHLTGKREQVREKLT